MAIPASASQSDATAIEIRSGGSDEWYRHGKDFKRGDEMRLLLCPLAGILRFRSVLVVFSDAPIFSCGPRAGKGAP